MPPAAGSTGGWMHPTSANQSALSLDVELKKREIATKLEQLSRRQAAREVSHGQLGVGSRMHLEQRLKELQRAKAIKKATDQEMKTQSVPGSPLKASATIRSPHQSATADAAASFEWAERLRQAKAKYWSNLDQMAPEWKNHGQQRRLDQLAKYEKAIDALLVRRQHASLAYAKERELQKLLTQKQLELHNLAAHEREEVRARQIARGLVPPPAHGFHPHSPIRPASASASAYPHQPNAHFSPASHVSHRSPYGAGPPPAVPSYAGHSISPSHSHPHLQGHVPSHGLGSSASIGYGLGALPSDAQLDAEARAARLAATEREIADLDTWRSEMADEERLRASRREERELQELQQRKLDLERRRALEMESDANLRQSMAQSRQLGAAVVHGTMPLQSAAYGRTNDTIQAQQQPVGGNPYAHANISPQQQQQHQQAQHQPVPFQPYPSLASHTTSSPAVRLTPAEPLPSKYDPSAAYYASSHQSQSRIHPSEPSQSQSSLSQSQEPQDGPTRRYSVSQSSLGALQPTGSTVPSGVDHFAAAQAEQHLQAMRKQQEEEQRAQAQEQAQEQERLEQQQQQQREEEARRQQQHERDAQEAERVRQQKAADEAAAAAAAAEAKAQAEREDKARRDADDAAAVVKAQYAAKKSATNVSAALKLPSDTPPESSTEAEASEAEDPAPPSSGFASLFSGIGSSFSGLGFMGGKKKPAAKLGGAAGGASRPNTAPSTQPSSTPAATKPASTATAAASKKKKGDSDDDTSDEEDTELKQPVPSLSSSMLKKKPLSARGSARKPWQTDPDIEDGDDVGVTRATTIRSTTAPATKKGAATLPEDDEFAF